MKFKSQKNVRVFNDEEQSTEPIDKQLPFFKPPTLLKSEPLPCDITNKTRNRIPRFRRFKVFLEKYEIERHKFLDPGGDVVLQWNRIFLFWCLVGLFIDPLFFYIPSIQMSGSASCVTTDLNLKIIVTIFRTIADTFYVLHIGIKFRTAYVSPSSRVFGRGELVKDPKLIATRYLRSDFMVDLIACLPIPQIVVWFILPLIRSSHIGHLNNSLVLIVLVQYLPRLYLIFPLSFEITKATGVFAKTACAGAAYNLLLYLLASHIFGAISYLLTVERYATCWKSECDQETTPLTCRPEYLDCGTLNRADRINWLKSTAVFNNCNASNSNINFNFGVFQNSLSNNVPSDPFMVKYFYCLWFGLQSLSSSGNNLNTSDFIVESIFASLVVISSLILFAHLLGNMATYLQSTTVRLEEWWLKRRDTEEWMRHRQLPHNLRERVRRFNQYKWVTTQGVNEESILHSLSFDLRRDIQRHLCLDLIRRVTFFSQMDDQLLDAICERLVSSLSTKETYIVHEGDPVQQMLFIIRGKLESSTTNGGRTGFFNCITLKPGDFCGEELLEWALRPNSTVNLPSSTRTVKAIEESEAFALPAEDLKFVANQFRRLHCKKLQHTFRYHSHHWRAWAACLIQASWRRRKRRMLAKSLSLNESFSSYDEEFLVQEMGREVGIPNSEGQSTSNMKKHLGVTILASRAAKNSRSVAQTTMLQKPEEPDFSVDFDEDLR